MEEPTTAEAVIEPLSDIETERAAPVAAPVEEVVEPPAVPASPEEAHPLTEVSTIETEAPSSPVIETPAAAETETPNEEGPAHEI